MRLRARIIAEDHGTPRILRQRRARQEAIQIHCIPHNLELAVFDPCHPGQALPAVFIDCHVAANPGMPWRCIVPPIAAVAHKNCGHAREVPERFDGFQVMVSVNDLWNTGQVV
jgi:hypothetical protein